VILSEGKVLGGIYCPLDNVLGAAIAEALGLLRSLEFLERIGCSSKVSIESNSLQLIQCCNSKTEVYSPYAILADCFVKASMITDVSFHRCPRSANQVTHELAKFAYNLKETNVWDGNTPAFILLRVI
jgi:hypothetical protein